MNGFPVLTNKVWRCCWLMSGLLMALVLISCQGEDFNKINLPIITHEKNIFGDIDEGSTRDGAGDPGVSNLPIIMNEENVAGDRDQEGTGGDGAPDGKTNLPIIQHQVSPTEVTGLAFTTIEHSGSTVSGALYESQEPGLVVIASPDDARSVNQFISEDAADRLASIDYGTHFAIIAFDGLKPTSSYKILVSQVSRTIDTVYVFALCLEPAADDIKADEVSSPYHLIEVEKGGDWGGTITFHLIIDGKIAASIAH